MLDPEERRRLERALIGSALGALALVGATIATVVLALRAGIPPGFESRGRIELAIALLLGWIWLLRRTPGRTTDIAHDLRQADVAVIVGVPRLLEQRAIGVFAPVRRTLALEGLRLGVSHIDPAAIPAGVPLELRYARRSRVLLSFRPAAPTTAVPAALPSRPELTDRDRRLLVLLTRGLSDKLIARELELTPSTVRTYNSALFQKLGAANRQDAVRIAREAGLVDVDRHRIDID